MRILMVAPQPFFEPRGTPFSVLHRIRALLRLGHTVDLVTYPLGESPELPGLAIHRSAALPGVREISIGPSLSKLLLDFPLVLRTYPLARSREFDLLHTHEEAGPLCGWIARACGMRHLYDMHSSLPQQFANFGRFNWKPIVATFERLEKHTLAGADGVIAICAELRDHVLACGYAGPVALIENCLDFDPPPLKQADLIELRSRLDLDSGPVVVYTGTLEPYQGMDLLLDAVRWVTREISNVRFVIVGGTQEQVNDLARAVHEREVEQYVRLIPSVPPLEVFSYHRLADALVTTRIKGTNTPLKVYQYLRAGKPIVATAVRSHTQVLNSDIAELVTPTPEGVAGGILRVLREPKRADALSAAATRLVQTRYSEQTYLDNLQDLIDRITHADPTN